MASQVFLGGSVRQNLLTLQNTTATANVTQSRLASGLKVASAIDDAVAYFTSKGLSDRAADISTRKGEIDQALSTVATAVQATEAIDSILKQLKGVLVAAKTATTTEKTALQTQFNTLTLQINLLAADASYNGTNLVNATTNILTVQFSALTTSVLTITGKDLQASVGLFTAVAVAGSPAKPCPRKRTPRHGIDRPAARTPPRFGTSRPTVIPTDSPGDHKGHRRQINFPGPISCGPWRAPLLFGVDTHRSFRTSGPQVRRSDANLRPLSGRDRRRERVRPELF